MAITNLLHRNKLNDFKKWLEDNYGLVNLPCVGQYEVLRWSDGRKGGPMKIILNGESKEHLTCNDASLPYVRKYLSDKSNGVVKMNYEEMSDFEINRELFPYSKNSDLCEQFIHNEEPNNDALMWCDGRQWLRFDPCNNPSDAWPFIFENSISIEMCVPALGRTGTATVYSDIGLCWQELFEDNDKAIRAAMICFLQMKERDELLK